MVVMGGSRLADSMTMSVFFPVVREEAQSRGEVETRAASSERAVEAMRRASSSWRRWRWGPTPHVMACKAWGRVG